MKGDAMEKAFLVAAMRDILSVHMERWRKTQDGFPSGVPIQRNDLNVVMGIHAMAAAAAAHFLAKHDPALRGDAEGPPTEG
jgi:hypothetical protein